MVHDFIMYIIVIIILKYLMYNNFSIGLMVRQGKYKIMYFLTSLLYTHDDE